MEASDVSLFSAVMGYAVMGKTLEDLQVQIDGFEEEEPDGPGYGDVGGRRSAARRREPTGCIGRKWRGRCAWTGPGTWTI